MDEISEKIFNEELDKLSLWKIQFRELYLNECNMDPEFEAQKFRIRIDWVTAWAWISKTTIIGSQSEQAQRERECICVADWWWKIIFTKNTMREVAEKLKNWKDAAIRKEITKNNGDWKNFLRSNIRNHERWSIGWSVTRMIGMYWRLKIFYDPHSPSSYDSAHVPHQALIDSISRKPGREAGMPRNTRENMSILGNVLIANMLDEILMNYTMIQEIWRHHWRFWEKKELRIVWAKNLALVLQWIKKIEATSSLKDLINPKSTTGKDFSEYEELDLMMAAELKQCYDIVYLIYEITERRAVTRQEGETFLHRAEDWRMFSAEDNWVVFKERRLKFFTHACHGRPWGQRGMKWRYAKSSHLEKAYSSVPKV